MDQKETVFIAETIVALNMFIKSMELLLKSLTEFYIKKGNLHGKNPNNFDHRRN